MSPDPLVSVIVIFLNGEKFLPEAVESILAQTYTRWELLLVDDGSTDSSTRMALNYAEQYPDKVRYLEHENHQNRGMSATRNLGIKQAKGDYIAFLDADDVWLPQKLAQQVAILEAHPEAAMLYGRTQIWYSWTGKPEDSQRDHFLELGVRPGSLVQPPELFLLSLKGGDVQTPTTCNVLIRRETIEAVGGFQESFRGMYEDQAFFIKLYLNAAIFVADEYWARYRQHPDSCCAVAEQTGVTNTAWLPFLEWVTRYLTEQGIHDRRVWQVARRQLRPYHHPRLDRVLNWTQKTSWTLQWKLVELVKQLLPAPAYSWLVAMSKTIRRVRPEVEPAMAEVSS